MGIGGRKTHHLKLNPSCVSFFVSFFLRGNQSQMLLLQICRKIKYTGNILAFLYVVTERVIESNTFFITASPEVTTDGAAQQFVVIVNEIQLPFHCNTSPPVSELEVRWEKDGIVISRNGSVENGSTGDITHFNDRTVQLTIVPSISSDSVNYTCVVINRINNLSATASVIIHV